MNNLNSVLIEGEIADVKRKNGEIFLDIVNKRKEGQITIPVQIGFTLNNFSYNNLQVRKRIRIVGKLTKTNFPGGRGFFIYLC